MGYDDSGLCRRRLHGLSWQVEIKLSVCLRKRTSIAHFMEYQRDDRYYSNNAWTRTRCRLTSCFVALAFERLCACDVHQRCANWVVQSCDHAQFHEPLTRGQYRSY